MHSSTTCAATKTPRTPNCVWSNGRRVVMAFQIELQNLTECSVGKHPFLLHTPRALSRKFARASSCSRSGQHNWMHLDFILSSTSVRQHNALLLLRISFTLSSSFSSTESCERKFALFYWFPDILRELQRIANKRVSRNTVGNSVLSK